MSARAAAAGREPAGGDHHHCVTLDTGGQSTRADGGDRARDERDTQTQRERSMDNLTADQRSSTMKAIRSTDTKPELLVRRMVFSLGVRYRLHRRDLPGCPDIVMPARRKVIFVHGCFWHGHRCKRGHRVPKTNTAYWTEKIARNKNRDRLNRRVLGKSGWTVLVVWECQLVRPERVRERIVRFLQSE